MAPINQILAEQADKLIYYSPYNFIKEISKDEQYRQLIKYPILDFHQTSNHLIIEIIIEQHVHYFYLAFLPWDSEYFQIPVYKIFYVLCHHSHFHILSKAITSFRDSFIATEKKYCFIEIPAEDILLLQAFTQAGFKLIETRLNYYMDQVQSYKNERFSVRKATENDIQNLRNVAAKSRNPYDRIHADFFFTTDVADHYLSTYIEQAIKGFTDIVLVPNEKDTPADAFIALSVLHKDSTALKCQLSRIILTAVAISCQGWHYKLVSEAIFYAKCIGAAYLLMTTQATNRAVIKNCEKLGFQLGRNTHILSDYRRV